MIISIECHKDLIIFFILKNEVIVPCICTSGKQNFKNNDSSLMAFIILKLDFHLGSERSSVVDITISRDVANTLSTARA